MGIYTKGTDVVTTVTSAVGYNPDHWVVDMNLRLPMTLLLKLTERKYFGIFGCYVTKDIIDYQPSDDQWWITGFNPSYKWKDANKMTAIFTIDFASRGDLYTAFYKKYGQGIEKKQNGLSDNIHQNRSKQDLNFSGGKG